MFHREHPFRPRPIRTEKVRLMVKGRNNMNKREIVQALMDSIQKGDFDNARSMLSDDFQFSSSAAQPIDAEAWLGRSASMKGAFPNLDYHFKVIGTNGDVVKSTAQLSGTHRGPFDLTDMNMGVIPATNKTFSARIEKTKVTVKDNKITLWAVESTDGAGIKAILGQLGVSPVAV
jgi:hypothetical protein